MFPFQVDNNRLMDGIGQTISLFIEPSQLVKVDLDPSTLFKMTVSHLESSDFRIFQTLGGKPLFTKWSSS
jgi:hypothetical protein